MLARALKWLMGFTLLACGCAALLIAVLAAGLAIGGILVPLLETAGTQVALGFVGVALIGLSFLADDPDMSGAALQPTAGISVNSDAPVVGNLVLSLGETVSSKPNQGDAPAKLDDKFLSGAVPSSDRGHLR